MRENAPQPGPRYGPHVPRPRRPAAIRSRPDAARSPHPDPTQRNRPDHAGHDARTAQDQDRPPALLPDDGERKKHLAEARFNVFHLTPSQVSFDMCSDGINAMSQEQLAGQFIGDEAYAGARNFEALDKAVAGRARPLLRLPDAQRPGLRQARRLDDAARRLHRARATRARASTSSGRPACLYPDVRDGDEPVFTGNIDLAKLDEILAEATTWRSSASRPSPTASTRSASPTCARSRSSPPATASG